jgi:hypothetical protein
MSAPTGNLETNLAKARDFLERFRGAPLGHFIAGKAESGASREIFDNVSPVDARVINQVISGDEQDVNAAATAAEAAFPPGAQRPVTSGARSFTVSPTRSKHVARKSRSWSAWIPGRRCVS